MATDDKSDTPVSKALKRRKELQDAVKASMKELEKIDDFLRMWRHLSADANEEIDGAEEGERPLLLGKAVHGQSQPMFEQYVRTILLDAGRPMRSDEIVEAFRERGLPLGGNETRTAWNRLWNAKKRGVLQSVPKYGYWFADEPVPESVLSAPPPKRPVGARGKGKKASWAGRPKGRKRALTDAQIATLEGWLLEGKKSRAEIARDLGGISETTVNNYRKAMLKRLEAEKSVGGVAHGPGKTKLANPMVTRRKLRLGK